MVESELVVFFKEGRSLTAAQFFKEAKTINDRPEAAIILANAFRQGTLGRREIDNMDPISVKGYPKVFEYYLSDGYSSEKSEKSAKRVKKPDVKAEPESSIVPVQAGSPSVPAAGSQQAGAATVGIIAAAAKPSVAVAEAKKKVIPVSPRNPVISSLVGKKAPELAKEAEVVAARYMISTRDTIYPDYVSALLHARLDARNTLGLEVHVGKIVVTVRADIEVKEMRASDQSDQQ